MGLDFSLFLGLLSLFFLFVVFLCFLSSFFLSFSSFSPHSFRTTIYWKMANFIPTLSAPTPFRTSRAMLGSQHPSPNVINLARNYHIT